MLAWIISSIPSVAFSPDMLPRHTVYSICHHRSSRVFVPTKRASVGHAVVRMYAYTYLHTTWYYLSILYVCHPTVNVQT